MKKELVSIIRIIWRKRLLFLVNIPSMLFRNSLGLKIISQENNNSFFIRINEKFLPKDCNQDLIKTILNSLGKVQANNLLINDEIISNLFNYLQKYTYNGMPYLLYVVPIIFLTLALFLGSLSFFFPAFFLYFYVTGFFLYTCSCWTFKKIVINIERESISMDRKKWFICLQFNLYQWLNVLPYFSKQRVKKLQLLENKLLKIFIDFEEKIKKFETENLQKSKNFLLSDLNNVYLVSSIDSMLTDNLNNECSFNEQDARYHNINFRS